MTVSATGSTPSPGVTGTYTPPTANRGADGTWSSTAADGMSDYQKAANRNIGNAFDGQTFLKLLVAQIKYQDPTKPADSTQLMQQTATLSMVDRINQMAESAEAMVRASEALSTSNKTLTEGYTAMLAEQRGAKAVGLIGKTVSYAAGAGGTYAAGEGAVESVRFDSAGPILRIGGQDVPLGAITSVKAAA